MNNKTVILLRKVIKELVSKEVSKQMKTILQEITNPKISTPAIEENLPSYMQEPDIDNVKSFTKDPVLNKILNETTGLKSKAEDMEEYPTMGGGVVDTPGKFMGMQAQRQSANQPQNMAGMPDFLQKAYNGHYKKVIDKVEATRGAKSK